MTPPVFRENTQVTLTVAVPKDAAGGALTVTSVDLAVLDETGTVIAPEASVTAPVAGAERFEAVLALAFNSIGASRRAARVVRVKMTTAEGVYETEELYLLEKPQQLEKLKNSFVTLGEAYMVARDMVGLDGWAAAEADERVAALVTAHRSLCRLTFRYKGTTSQSRITWGQSAEIGYSYVTEIKDITEGEWTSTPEHFRTALMRAQLAEADILLQGDPVGEKRRAGIVSETIGESSMFFRQNPEVHLPISRAAMEHLAGYVYRDTRISRA